MAKKRSKKSSGLNLSAPKQITWVISVIVGVLGLLSEFAGLSIGVESAVLLAIGFVVLAVATAANGL
ncbi:MAG: hypothetical protein KF698_06650 [Anaerolineales bacterium]|nr:hypothetical protein [Anaerolineales bacterium]